MKSLTVFILSLSVLNLFSQTYYITDYGAVADGSTLNTSSIQTAIDICNTNGGGTVLLSGGSFLSGTIVLKSNVALKIDSSATLLGSSDLLHYPDINTQVVSMADGYVQKALVFAENASNITLTGKGKLDGQGSSFLGVDGPFGIRFSSCQNVLIENLELRNSGFWMMHNQNIDTLTMRNLNIYNHSHPNNDGLSVDGCRNVLIENCTVDANNDPLVFKAMGLYNCENIEARNCTLATWSRAIKIGTETAGGFRNIHVHDCTVEWSSLSSQSTGFGSADCGINLSIVDGGFIENVIIENVTLEGLKQPLLVRLGNRGRNYSNTEPPLPTGTSKNIILRNIDITAEETIPGTISGIPDHYIQNLTLENFTINYPGGEQAIDTSITISENESAKPDCDLFGSAIPASGLFIRHVDNLNLNNVCFNYESPDYREVLYVNDAINSPLFSETEPSSTASKSCVISTPTGILYLSNQEREIWYDMIHKELNYKKGVFSHTSDISIYDLSGKVISQSKGNNSNKLQIEINTKGIYLWKMYSNQGEFSSGKFIIQ